MGDPGVPVLGDILVDLIELVIVTFLDHNLSGSLVRGTLNLTGVL